MTVSLTNFWLLSAPDDTRGHADWDDSVDLAGPIVCPVYPAHQRAGKRTSALHVVLPSAQVCDFVWTWTSECLVQESVLSLFEAEGVTGFVAEQATARFARPDREAPRLSEIVPTGWGGIAPKESGVRLMPEASCQYCGLLVYSGFKRAVDLIDETQWDGSDVFIVWPFPRLLIVTERVARLIEAHELSGARLQRLADVRGTQQTVSPGRLSYWMPEERARSLGSSVGIA
jgi:hypothetical protein